MPEIGNTAVWSQTDASNNTGTMPSWSGSASPNTIDDAGRAMMGAITREWNWRNPTLTSTGSADAYVLTYSVAPAAYYNGQTFRFIASFANTGACTLNINTIGAKAIKKVSAGSLADPSSGDIASGAIMDVSYNLSNDCFLWFNSAPAAATTSATGLVELATAGEVLTGTDQTRAATPFAVNGLWGKLADIASAGTVTIGSGGYAHITGTTTITDIDFTTATNGRWVYIVFDGALTLIHNATTLILPSGANITTAAGDTALFIQDAADNIKCLFYQRADGTPIAPAVTAASVASQLGLFTTVSRVTDSSITTNTTLASDDTLKFAMLANTAYQVEASLLLDVDADSGWKLGITGPASPTEVVCLALYSDDNGTNRNSSVASYTQLDANTPGADRISEIRIRALIRNGANAGDFALQFAQNASSATAFVIKRGSRLSYRVNA